jgi:hypothetical protein
MRRFFAPDKEKCGAFLRTQKNVGEGRRGNEGKRNNLAARNPEPPQGGEAHTDLLGAVFSSSPFFILFHHL